jgi:FixJ family two-component response regulator
MGSCSKIAGISKFGVGRNLVTKQISDDRALRPPSVLLLEDDAACRYSLPLLWRSQNLEVIVTDDGDEALAMCQDQNHAIGAVVVDIFMTKMRGDEFAERLALVRPDLPVIFISGLPEDELISRGILTGDELFFQKPIVTTGLVEILASLLGIELPKRRKRLEHPPGAQLHESLTIKDFMGGGEREER